ncbi:MAG: hypothetical protein V4618_01590 [Pseudomonadota bacterium]
MGILLALLLGVAAAFFVLAMPIHMLESVTTATRLSKLMVQAEPPISPNDRTLLSILAGILTTGIGWVLVDWLMFGRAGISTLIRTREDDYEDEDEDQFRPTDPLDLVESSMAPPADWPAPPSGDTRRPLSARTDIGDPPLMAGPFGGSPGAINQALPPINDILLGAGTIAPPLQANPLPPLVAPSVFAPPPLAPQALSSEQGAHPSWPPLDLGEDVRVPASMPAAPQHFEPPMDMPAVASGLPSWMPAPGMRPVSLTIEPLPDAFFEEPAETVRPEPSPVPDPEPAMPMVDHAAIIPADPLPPMLGAQSAFPPPPFDWAPSAPTIGALYQEPAAITPPIVATPPVAVAPVAPQPIPALRPMPPSGFKPGELEDLLGRLERGLQQRRAAAASASQPAQAVSAPVPASASPLVAPVALEPIAAPAAAPPGPAYEGPRDLPPAGFSAPPPLFPPAMTPLPVPANEPRQAEPSPYTLGIAPPPSAEAPASILPLPPTPVPSDGRNDELLDQPLHVTLDLLRSMVKR